jgi:outer membrane receptor protein involved in Fe transport
VIAEQKKIHREQLMPVISPLFTLRCSVITLAALTYPVAHAAQTPRSIEAEQITKYQFEIPSQALGDALQAFARASRQQLSFDSAVVSGRTSTALLGEFTAEEAIRRLLEGSGLEFRRGSQGVWLIAPERKEESAEGRNSARIQLEEIVVTGTNIRGATEVAAPSITVTREDLDKTGYSSIEGLLDDLPQNFAAISFDGAQALESASRVAQRNGVDRASGIDLRGLGAESTLTLVNGTRRAGSIDGRVVDVSVIPLSAIERVEIVTGGRSAIYGSDAVAGVVNLVTRRSFEGAETQVVYGSPTGFGGGEKLQLSQIAGTSGARGSIVAAYDYQRDEPLDLVDTGHDAPLRVSFRAHRRDRSHRAVRRCAVREQGIRQHHSHVQDGVSGRHHGCNQWHQQTAGRVARHESGPARAMAAQSVRYHQLRQERLHRGVRLSHTDTVAGLCPELVS